MGRVKNSISGQDPGLLSVPGRDDDDDDETPRTYRSEVTPRATTKETSVRYDDAQLMSAKKALDMLSKTLQCYKRAVVGSLFSFAVFDTCNTKIQFPEHYTDKLNATPNLRLLTSSSTYIQFCVVFIVWLPHFFIM